MWFNNWKRILSVLFLAAFYRFSGGAAVVFAADQNLDQNEEIQWVMGDLSALKTAAQTYYSDSKKDKSVPSLSDILAYFDDQSLPPNASSLYAVKGNRGGWYVGYQSRGLKDETYRLLEENAGALGIVGDDLKTPWKKGNIYIWSGALSLSTASPSVNSSGGSASGETNNYTTNNYTTNNYTTDTGSGSSGSTTYIDNDNSATDAAVGAAAVLVGTAALLSIIDNHDNYYYNYPGQPWFWHSSIVYRPVYYDRFFDHYYRPVPLPPRPLPRPVYRYNVPHAGYIAPSYRQSFDRARYNYDPHRDRVNLDRNRIDNHVNAQKRINNRKTVNVNNNNVNINRNRGIQQGNRQGQGRLQPRETPRLKNDVQRRDVQRKQEGIQQQRPQLKQQQRQAPQVRRQQEQRPKLQNREVERPQIEQREFPRREGGGGGGGRIRRR